ncbi:zinc finger CCHC domain-containing protein 3-like [Leucoraja erinacea]|uniref:zinc finger CCHC domain-containing protein 3-like n=1 Tax=Leucoraja erinaceus TaxID=7782 RepID=UPI0024584A58|nr:zinc finger CCHC domain-containing protein 3-like [Leucoraja erinacea]
MQDFREKGNDAPLSLLKVQPLFTLPTQKERMITVHMFNPHVPVVDVLTFLARHVEGAGNCVDVKDLFGIWTSKRQVKVKLRVDKDGAIIHPPVFTIRGNRGYMAYTGQPRLCRKCNKPGHVAAQCSTVVCKNCKLKDHATKNCQVSKNCNLCGEAGHLYRACPKRACTYTRASTPHSG